MYGLGTSRSEGIVNLVKEVGLYNVTSVKDDDGVVDFELRQVEDGILQRFSLAALVEVGRQQRDGQLCQLHVRQVALVVGNNYNVK